MENLENLMTVGDQNEYMRLMLAPLLEEGMTSSDWQITRQSDAFKALMTAAGDMARGCKRQRLVNQMTLPLRALPDNGFCRANTDLSYDLSQQFGLDEQYDRLTDHLGHLGLQRSDLELDRTEPDGTFPGGFLSLRVNTYDLAVRLGLDVIVTDMNDPKQVAAKAAAYCRMVGPLVTNLPKNQPVVSDWLKGCLAGNYALLEMNAGRQWSASSRQAPGQLLRVYQGWVNPAARFLFDDEVYSLSPNNVCDLSLPNIAVGDLTQLAILATTVPSIVKQIAVGNGPWIDVSGTRLFDDNDDDEWSDSPYCSQNDGEVWLNGYWPGDDARGNYGSLLFRE